MSADLFRKVSVVFQFTISMLLITATIVISQQVDYIQTKNLGFNRDHLISIPLEGDLVNQYAVFKQQALQLQSIQSVTQATQAPSQSENYWTNEIYWDGKNPNTKPAFVNLSVGYDFTKTMDVQLLEGRDFSPSFATDSFGYILNETALRQTGYQAPIGKQFTCNGQTGNIIGIIKDFHFNSLHDPVYPLILSYTKASNGNTIMIRATKNKTREALADLESLCRQLNPKFPFTYSFADADFQKLYTSETIIHKLADYFSMLAVFISSLGLLALVMFTAEQRIKEISIRKVLGASIIHIGSLLLSGFIKLIAIAMLVAIPAAWLFMHQWLQNFAYKIDMQWWMFALAGAITFLIALLIVSYQIIKVTLLSPVKNLRM